MGISRYLIQYKNLTDCLKATYQMTNIALKCERMLTQCFLFLADKSNCISVRKCEKEMFCIEVLFLSYVILAVNFPIIILPLAKIKKISGFTHVGKIFIELDSNRLPTLNSIYFSTHVLILHSVVSLQLYFFRYEDFV